MSAQQPEAMPVTEAEYEALLQSAPKVALVQIILGIGNRPNREQFEAMRWRVYRINDSERSYKIDRLYEKEKLVRLAGDDAEANRIAERIHRLEDEDAKAEAALRRGGSNGR